MGDPFSSVFEWLFAMGMVNQYAQATGNDKWKALTYGMLPLHASGVAACTYHFFYNAADVGFLVTLQAGLTLLGNTTVAIAAILIAISSGWTVRGAIDDAKAAIVAANPLQSDEAKAAAEAERAAVVEARRPAGPLVPQDVPSKPLVAAELLLLTLATSYLVKYGETVLPFAFEPNAALGGLICVGIPAAVFARFYGLPKPTAV